MVKTPSTRHSKTHREPVTIELEPGAVSRISDTETEPSASDTGMEPSGSAEAQAASDTSRAQDAAMAEKTADAPAASAKPEQVEAGQAAPAFENLNSETPAGEEPAETKSPRDRQTQKPAPRVPRSGFSPLAAGILGGVIALAGAGALQFSGLLPTPRTDGGGAISAVNSRAELSGMQQDIAALKDVSGRPDAQTANQVETVTKSLDQMKSELAGLRETVQAATPGADNGVQALEERVKQIDTTVAALRQQQDAGVAASSDINALGERIAGVEALAKANGETVSTADGKLTALEQKVTDLSNKIEAQAGQPKVALAIAASALKSAIERGAPFEAELETFAAISPDAPGIGDLRAYAQKGVPTLAAIQAETKPAIQAMIAADRPVDERAGVLDRLVSSAQSLVSVRPVGPVEGTGVPETTARMEFEINAGELGKALAEYDSLPEPVKAAGSGLADKIRARVGAQKLVDQAVAGAMKA